MSILSLIGVAASSIGLLLILVGTGITWRDSVSRWRGGKGVSETIDSLARFAEALAKHPPGLRLVFLGILLLLVGAALSGASSLMA